MEVGVRILIVSGIQDFKAQHSAFHEQKFPTFRIPQAKFSRIPICGVTAMPTLFMITQIATCKSAEFQDARKYICFASRPHPTFDVGLINLSLLIYTKSVKKKITTIERK